MGRATITAESRESGGLYTVSIDYGTQWRDEQVAALDAQISELDAQIAGFQGTLDAFKATEEGPAESRLNAAVLAFVAVSGATPANPGAVEAARREHDAALRALVDVRGRYRALELTIEEMRSRVAAARKRRAELAALELAEVVEAWCADYTLDASGEVATIDIPGESGRAIIAPGAPAPTATDGELVAREAQEGLQVFFNAAILPGWQRWMPTFRIGELLRVDIGADVVDVQLDDAASSAQGLPINAASLLYDVPVRYMTCNAAAFEAGDRVVVQFDEQEWDAPSVIGFETNPRPCNMAYFGAEYDEVYDFGYTRTHWALSALVDVERLAVVERWETTLNYALGGMLSLNGQPYWEVSGFLGEISGVGPEAIVSDVLIEADGGSSYTLPAKAMSLAQVAGKLYGIEAEYRESGIFRLVREFDDSPPFGLLDTWAAAGSNASISTLHASADHIAVGGWLGASYGVRVLDIQTRALVLEFSTPDPVESVWVTSDYLAAMHWGGGTFRIELYRRSGAGYTFMQSFNTLQYPYSMCLVGNYICGKERNDLWVWRIDQDSCAVTFHGHMEPLIGKGGDVGVQLPGEPSMSGFLPDGSGRSGHRVCAVRRT